MTTKETEKADEASPEELVAALEPTVLALEKVDPFSPEEIKRHQSLVQAYVDSLLVENCHFGRVPGVDKPFLWQPGAETLAQGFLLMPTYEVDATEGPEVMAYRVLCRLQHRPSGKMVGEAWGACNSREDKYRFRTVPSFKARPGDREKAEAYGEIQERQGRSGAFELYRIPVDPWSIQQTLLAMAQKRAYVAAVRNTLALTGMFTIDQDIVEGLRNIRKDEATSQEPPSALALRELRSVYDSWTGLCGGNPEELSRKVFKITEEETNIPPQHLREGLAQLSEEHIKALVDELTAECEREANSE